MADQDPDLPDGGDIKAALTKKLGPLPVGVWILAVGGGLIIAYMIRRRTAAPEEDPGTGRNTDTAPGVGGNIPNPSSGDRKRPTTNEEWYQLALEAILASSLAYSPTFVDSALRKYIGGQRLTTAEQAVISLAIRLVGAPPIPVPVPPPGDGGDDDDDTTTPPPTTPRPPDVDPPGRNWDTDGRSRLPDEEPPEGWDGGGRLPDAGPFDLPGHPGGGWYTPLNRGRNPLNVVNFWLENDGERLKNAQPREPRTYSPPKGTPRGNPKPDGPPGYVSPGRAGSDE